MLISKLRRIYQSADFTVPNDHRVKIKESKNIDIYFDLASTLKKQWNTKVTIKSIVIGQLEMFPEDLERRLEKLNIQSWKH